MVEILLNFEAFLEYMILKNIKTNVENGKELVALIYWDIKLVCTIPLKIRVTDFVASNELIDEHSYIWRQIVFGNFLSTYPDHFTT
jgi:hypothetical protein